MHPILKLQNMYENQVLKVIHARLISLIDVDSNLGNPISRSLYGFGCLLHD